jgi:hypothetical protein
LPGWRHAIGQWFVSFLANRETAKQPNQRGGGGRGRDVPATTQAAPQLGAQAVVATAGRSWPARGWLAVSKRGRQAVKGVKEQTAKASRKLAAARPSGTTTVAPPTGAPPGPVPAQVTKLPNDDGDDEMPGPKPDTQTETATAEPPTSQ